MTSFSKMLQWTLIWVLLIAFVIFYPMLISIYVFLPLFVGVMGYVFMRGLELNKPSYMLLALAYFMNLEANLTLPFFLALIATLFVFSVFYPHLNSIRKCSFCRPVLSVILIDLVYLGFLLMYDFLFQTSSIVLDNILIYSFIVDILVVVLV